MKVVASLYAATIKILICVSIAEFIFVMSQGNSFQKVNPSWAPIYLPGHQLTKLGTKISRNFEMIIHLGHQPTKLGTILPIWALIYTILGTKLS